MKVKQKKHAKLEWKRAFRTPSGSRTWESRCGNFRVHCAEVCYGVKLKPYYTASQREYRPGYDLPFWVSITRTTKPSQTFREGRSLTTFPTKAAAIAACESRRKGGK